MSHYGLPIRLLCSARDPAAGQAMINIIKSTYNDSRFLLRIIASAPASTMFEGLSCKCDFLSEKDLDSPQSLNIAVEGVLRDFQPDAVIAGSSGPDAGVDEFLVKLAVQSSIRSYVVQDFWGDLNLSLGVPADCYLVADEFAKSLTKQRVEKEIYVVGSVKHALYNTFNITDLRRAKRASLGVGEHDQILGFFGMPLGHLQGYWKTLEQLVSTIKNEPTLLIYRPHPKEDIKTKAQTREIMSTLENYTEDEGVCVERTLSACDLVLSCYSSCGIDSELLGRGRHLDDRISIFLLFEPEVREYFQNYSHLSDIPTSTQKRTITISKHASLKATINKFLSKPERLKFLNGCLSALPLATQSVSLLLDKVYSDLCHAIGSCD